MTAGLPRDSAAEDAQVQIADLLAEQLTRLFSREVTRESLAQAQHGALDTRLWHAVTQIGAASMLAAEDQGGAGLSWLQASGVLRLLGSHLPPVPLGETSLARWALGRAGVEAPEAPVAVSGEDWQIDREGRVSGADHLVSWVPGAELILVSAPAANGRLLALLPLSEAQVQPHRTIDRLPAARVSFRDAKPQLSVAAPGVLGGRGLLVPLAVLRSLQMAGNLLQILALCLDYANTRSQFGRTLGKFQAIQHLLAELAEVAAAAQVASSFAARQLDAGDCDAAALGAAVAKIRAGVSATRGAAIAHQVFGAIGITDEHILHHHTRRLWQWRAEAGSESTWSEWLGGRALASPGQGLWSGLVTGSGRSS
jgi:acyl-CoA dehydrogenase